MYVASDVSRRMPGRLSGASRAARSRAPLALPLLVLPVVLLTMLAACDDDPAGGGGPAPVASVAVAPAEHQLTVGDTVRLQAMAKSATGEVVEGRTASWTSADTAVARVDAGGLVVARGVGSTRIIATVEGKPGEALLTVRAPDNPVPVTAELSPATVQAGAAAFTLTVTGQGFASGATVRWNGAARPTTVVSATTLRAEIAAADVAQAGGAVVTVVNPAPGGGTSAALGFVVAAPPPPVGYVFVQSPGGAPWLWTGHVLGLTVTTIPAGGEAQGVQWASSDPAVATVDSTGRVRALAPGTATITATVQGKQAGLDVTVWPTPTHDIVYEDSSSGTPELFIYRLGGSVFPVRLLPTGTFAQHPAPSPDGSRIAFTGRDAGGSLDVYVVARDGSGLTRLTTSAATDDQPAWSPDGSRIAFRSTRDGKSDVWVMNADGSGQRNLTKADVWVPEEWNERPAWSPDGAQLAFQRTFGIGGFQIWTVRADGTGLKQLTRNGSDTEPAWNPYRAHITFRRTPVGTPGASSQLMEVDLQGTEYYWVIDPPLQVQTPAWSPEGGWLAYAGLAGGPANTGIVLSRGDGGPTRVLTTTGANPSWLRRP